MIRSKHDDEPNMTTTSRYRSWSRYRGKSSTRRVLVAGRSSEVLMQTAFPAAMATALEDVRVGGHCTRVMKLTMGLISNKFGWL